MRAEITFGIITDGNQPVRVKRLIDSIKALNAPAEIVLVGGGAFDGVTHIPFDETDCKDCICHKKNLITLHAKSEIVVYCHDYLTFESDWYENFIAFGYDWDIQLNPITRPDGNRYRDWIGVDTFLQPYDKPFDSTMYINGAYWIAKKRVGVEFPQNESLRWKENDEIDFSERIKTANIKVVMNPNSKVKTQYNKGAFVPDGKPVDIVYKTYSKDAPFLWDSLRSVKLNVTDFNRIYLLTDDALGAIPNDLKDLPITVVKTPFVKFDKTLANNSVGYTNQILIKLSLFYYVEIDRCLLLDSDMLINSEWDISKEGNRWWKREWTQAGDGVVWKGCVDAIIGADSFQCMGYPGWFLTRNLMNSFLVYLQEILRVEYIDPNFWNALLNKTGKSISEFELWGNYLCKVDPLDYELNELNGSPYPITQLWSYGGHSKAKPEIQKILMAKENAPKPKTVKSKPVLIEHEPTPAAPSIERIPAPIEHRYVEAHPKGGEHWRPTEIVRAINEALAIVPQADYVVLTSPTATLINEQFDQLVDVMDENPNCVICQPSSSQAHDFLKNTPARPSYRKVPFVEFWCAIIRVAHLKANPLDLGFTEGWGCDVDFAMQAQVNAGKEIAVTESITVAYDKSKQIYPSGHAARADNQMKSRLKQKWNEDQVKAIEAATGAKFDYFFAFEKKK